MLRIVSAKEYRKANNIHGSTSKQLTRNGYTEVVQMEYNNEKSLKSRIMVLFGDKADGEFVYVLTRDVWGTRIARLFYKKQKQHEGCKENIK